MPRRRPGQVRADRYYRLRTTTTAHDPIANLPGLSPHGRTVLAFLERTRLWSGAAKQALRSWKGFIRSPHHRIYDYAYDDTGCGVWECCPSMAQVQEILTVVAHTLPPRDAHRFRRLLAQFDEWW